MSEQWPEPISFKTFKAKVKHSNDKLYLALFNQHSFEIANERIAVKNLQRICEATFVLANEVGFQAMTLRQLSKQTGMSMGGLYAYIKSKDDLARLIYSFLDQYCENMIRQLIEDDMSANQMMNVLIKSHLYMSELLQPWFYFAYMETKNLAKEYKGTAILSELTMEKMLYESITQGLKAGCFTMNNESKEKRLLTASMIKALLQDWYLKRWKYSKRKISVDQYAQQVVEITLEYLQFDKSKDCP